MTKELIFFGVLVAALLVSAIGFIATAIEDYGTAIIVLFILSYCAKQIWRPTL